MGLVLSRQFEEETVMVIPPSSEETIITTKLIDIRWNSVRTNYEAPDAVRIYRRELYDEIQSQNRAMEGHAEGKDEK